MSNRDEEISNKDLYTLLQSVQKTIETNSKAMRKEFTEEIRRESGKLMNKIEEQNNAIKALEVRYSDLEKSYEGLQKKLRKNNIIISGLTVSNTEDLLSCVIARINQLLDVDVVKSDVNNLYKLKTQKDPLIKIELTSYIKKLEIIKNAFKLRGTNIVIFEDLDLQERKERKMLVTHLKRARNAGLDAKLRGSKLLVEGSYYKCEELHKLTLPTTKTGKKEEEPTTHKSNSTSLSKNGTSGKGEEIKLQRSNSSGSAKTGKPNATVTSAQQDLEGSSGYNAFNSLLGTDSLIDQDGTSDQPSQQIMTRQKTNRRNT